jgi:hypothetical protein
LDAITHFHLSHNQLSGTLPIEMASWENTGQQGGIRPLRYFNVYSNNLVGPIPNDLKFRKCQYFDVGRNQLTGTLPADIGTFFVELRQLHLDHNQFRGTVPSSYNSVGNGRLESLSIDHNFLTGVVPGERDLTNKLVTYTLHENNFNSLDPGNCDLLIPFGEMVEFKADCDICQCDDWMNICSRHCGTTTASTAAVGTTTNTTTVTAGNMTNTTNVTGVV